MAESSSREEEECAVCYQKCIQPVRLECLHVFCFLCVKGASQALRSRPRCPMCRREISPSFLVNPTLVAEEDEEKGKMEQYKWFYEGRNGWWQYDERTIVELEDAYQKFNEGGQVEQDQCDLLIAGFLYAIDFRQMVQYRKSEPSRRRRINRDVVSSIENLKGVAGIRKPDSDEHERIASSVTAPLSASGFQPQPSSSGNQTVSTPLISSEPRTRDQLGISEPDASRGVEVEPAAGNFSATSLDGNGSDVNDLSLQMADLFSPDSAAAQNHVEDA